MQSSFSCKQVHDYSTLGFSRKLHQAVKDRNICICEMKSPECRAGVWNSRPLCYPEAEAKPDQSAGHKARRSTRACMKAAKA